MILRRFTPEQNAALAFALARTLLSAYRAATQSLSIDEATVFLNFLRGPWAKLYQHYDVNNHLLYSALAKLCTRWFGVSEFSLRLPSVLAGLFLMLGVFAVLELAVESRAIRWSALLFIGLNPLLMDLTIAARGYGLGLALLVWGVYFAMRGREYLAGVLLGLSASAVVVMAAPGAGLAVAVLLLARGDFAERVRRTLELAIPAAAIGFLIGYPAFRSVNADQFYVGEHDLGASVLNLVFTSIRTSVRHIGLFGTARGAQVIEDAILPALLLLLAAAGVRAWFRDPDSRVRLVPAAALAAVLAGLVVAHRIAGLNYPVERVGMYLFVLFGLAWAIAADHWSWGRSWMAKPVLAVNAALAAVLALQFLTQFETRYFSLWPFDLPAKQVARILKQQTAGRDAGSISVSASWFQTPALEFYRYYYGIVALQPIERRDPTLLTGFDYYVLNLKDDAGVKGADLSRLIPVYREPISGVLLGKDADSLP